MWKAVEVRMEQSENGALPLAPPVQLVPVQVAHTGPVHNLDWAFPHDATFNTFRGRPLHGTVLPLPTHAQLLVCRQETPELYSAESLAQNVVVWEHWGDDNHTAVALKKAVDSIKFAAACATDDTE